MVEGGPTSGSVASERPTLLIADDEVEFRQVLGEAMERRGFDVRLAGDAKEAVAHTRDTVLEYALVDVRMPGVSGLALVPKLLEIDEGTRIVVMTGYGTINNAVDAMKTGAVDYLTKPVDAETCMRALMGSPPNDAPDDIPSVERVEWEYLHRVLADCDGNISEASRRLRMHRRSLQRKIGKNAPSR